MFCLFPYLPRRWKSHGRQRLPQYRQRCPYRALRSFADALLLCSPKQRIFLKCGSTCAQSRSARFPYPCARACGKTVERGGRRFHAQCHTVGFFGNRARTDCNRLITVCLGSRCQRDRLRAVSFCPIPDSGRTERIGFAAASKRNRINIGSLRASPTAITNANPLPADIKPTATDCPPEAFDAPPTAISLVPFAFALKPTATVRNASALASLPSADALKPEAFES